MFNYLEQLRRKPIAYRRRVLLFSTTAITGVVVLVWLSTFSINETSDAIDAGAIEKELRPIDEIKTSVVNFYDSIKSFGSGIFGGSSTTSPDQPAN